VEDRVRRTAAWAALGGVAAYGAGRARLPAAARFTGNLVAAGVALAAASALGVDRAGLGLAAGRHVQGIRWGGMAGGTVAAAVAGLATIGPTRPYFADERISAHSNRRAAVEASLRIPLETAAAEELLFRGAVLGLATDRLGDVAGVAVSSVLFGLWHVPPALDALGASGVADVAGGGPVGRWGAVTGTVAATSVAGVVFAELRRRSGSVVAPALVHGALNVTGFAAARRAGTG
jgi:membrane protease YdiL (CAAX protease family)